MILVDDRLALDVLANRGIGLEARSEPAAMTWGFHYRLMRALTDDRVVGALSGLVTPPVRLRAARPPADRLLVLDPRQVTESAAVVAVRHGVNLLAAELVATASMHSARVALSAANVGRRWPEIFAEEGIAFDVFDAV